MKLKFLDKVKSKKASKKIESLSQPKTDTSIIDAIEKVGKEVESLRRAPIRIVKPKVKDSELLLIINQKLDKVMADNTTLHQKIDQLEIKEEKPIETEEVEVINPLDSPELHYDDFRNPVEVPPGKKRKFLREKRE